MDQQGKPAGTTADTSTAQTLLAEDPVPHGDEALPEASAQGESLLELILAEHGALNVGDSVPPGAAAAENARIDGVVVGVIVAFDAAGAPIVTFPGGPESGLVARALAAIGPGDADHEVALLFEGGDPARPLVMGKMHTPRNVGDGVPPVAATRNVDDGVPPGAAARAAKPIEVKTDGDRVELRAEKEIVLSCGKASITLTRAGKILIRGEYVLSRSNGVHRIQGGSVQIN